MPRLDVWGLPGLGGVRGWGGLGEEAEEDTGGHGGTDYTGNVRAHGVHEQVVGGVVFQAEVVGDAGRHGDG